MGLVVWLASVWVRHWVGVFRVPPDKDVHGVLSSCMEFMSAAGLEFMDAVQGVLVRSVPGVGVHGFSGVAFCLFCLVRTVCCVW